MPNDYIERRSPIQAGNILYVREAWNKLIDWKDEYPDTPEDADEIYYKADYTADMYNMAKWRSPVTMPKEAARLFLKITNVRIESLQDISSDDVDAEGQKEYAYDAATGELLPSKPTWFMIKWDNRIKKSDLDKYGWNANPWVFVYEFEVLNQGEAK